MGDREQIGKPPWYVTSHPGQLSLAIHPWVGAMSSSESWAKTGTPHDALVSVVWQCKLVCGSGLRKRRSAPTVGFVAREGRDGSSYSASSGGNVLFSFIN